MNFLSFALSLLPSSPPNTPEPAIEIPQGMSWCDNCERHTARDALPGTSFGGKPIPTWWFCCFCGQCDFDFEGDAA